MSTSPSFDREVDSPPVSTPARTINGRYKVIRELGRGGMGQVLLVADSRRDFQELALKTLLATATDPDFIDRFRTEFAGLARLRHANISAAFDFGKIAGEDAHFFTSEYVPGVDLGKGSQGARLDLLLDLIFQVLRGLEFIHSHGLLHNDLKPQNILIARPDADTIDAAAGSIHRLEASVFGSAGQVKIIDFGLLSAENVAWGKILGSVRFISPERIRCQKADRRSDLYSLGVVLYWLFARRCPFEDRDARAILKLHLERPAPSLAERAKGVPPAIVDLVARLLKKRPEDRFASAAEALSFLEAELPANGARGSERRGRQLDRADLWGREDELRRLQDGYLAAVSTPQAAVGWVVSGPSGIGKTRLLQELRGFVQVQGGAFIEVTPLRAGRHLGPVGDAIVSALATSGAGRAQDLQGEIEARVKEQRGEQSAETLAAALEDLLIEKARKTPLFVHFDDFHRSNPTLRNFAMSLVSSAARALRALGAAPRIMVALCLDESELLRSSCLGGMTVVRLGAFSKEKTGALLGHVLAQEPPIHLQETVFQVSQGNPGHVLELLRQLIESKVITRSGLRWSFPESLGQIELPRSVGEALDRRLGLLGARSRSILRWLSISAEPLGVGPLSKVCLAERKELSALLERLVSQGVVLTIDRTTESKVGDPHTSSSGGLEDRAYYLAHGGAQAILLKDLGDQEIKKLHQRLAQVHEEELEVDLGAEGRLSETIAHHWLIAGNSAAFLRYAPAAAASLSRGGNLRLAAEYHKRLAESIPEAQMAKKVQSLAKLAELHELLWDLESGRKDLDEILRLGGTLLKPQDRSALHRRAGQMEMGRHRLEEALFRFTRARKELPPDASPVLVAALDAPEAWARWFQGEREAASALLERASRILQEHSLEDPRHEALAASAAYHVSSLLMHTGRLVEAEEIARANVARLEQLKSPQALAAARCLRGALLMDLGRQESATAELEAALELSRRLGDLRTSCRAREKLAELYLWTGDLRSALSMSRASLEDANILCNPSAKGSALHGLGRLHAQAGQLSDARETLEKALEAQAACGDQVHVPLTLCDLASTLAHAGEAGLARARAQEALDLSLQLGLPLPASLARAILARLDTPQSYRRAIEGIVAESAALKQAGHAIESSRLLLTVTQIAIDAGDGTTATLLLEHAESEIEEAGSPEQKLRLRALKATQEAAHGDRDAGYAALKLIAEEARERSLPSIELVCRRALGR